MPSGHVKGKSASVSSENNLAKFHALVHSCSSDRRWAIRFVAARIDFLSERANAIFPQQAGQPAGRGRKAIQGQPTLAITDGSTADDSWGPWHSFRQFFRDHDVHSKAKEEIPAEMPTPGAPETAQAVTPEASDLEDLWPLPKLFVGIVHDWLYTALHSVQQNT